MNNFYKTLFLIALVIYFTGCASFDGTYEDCVHDGLENCDQWFFNKGGIK